MGSAFSSRSGNIANRHLSTKLHHETESSVLIEHVQNVLYQYCPLFCPKSFENHVLFVHRDRIGNTFHPTGYYRFSWYDPMIYDETKAANPPDSFRYC